MVRVYSNETNADIRMTITTTTIITIIVISQNVR